jgi:hypothetical protein
MHIVSSSTQSQRCIFLNPESMLHACTHQRLIEKEDAHVRNACVGRCHILVPPHLSKKLPTSLNRNLPEVDVQQFA